MSVLDREALEQSPLADLHAIASELSIDSYRLLRREPLIDAILARQAGADGTLAPAGALRAAAEAPAAAPTRPRRRRSRARAVAEEPAEAAAPPEPPEPEKPEPEKPEPEKPEPGEDSASERARFEAAPARFPHSVLRLGGEDPALAAMEALAPFGLGSRVTVVGPPRAGKTELLRRIAGALPGRDGLRVLLLLVGVRPEEIGEWQQGSIQPVQALSFAAPTSAQDRAVYAVIDEVRPHALRGGDAIVLIDTLDGLHEQAARRALATARNLAEGGSVTVIATASEPFGGETTVVGLDPVLAAAGRYPALDPKLSGTMRPELLVGEEGAQTIARGRATQHQHE
jgi:transcription termination factor Rho